MHTWQCSTTCAGSGRACLSGMACFSRVLTIIAHAAGADSLGNDKLGDFNLSIRTHAAAVAFMKKFNVPMLVTGGELLLDMHPAILPAVLALLNEHQLLIPLDL